MMIFEKEFYRHINVNFGPGLAIGDVKKMGSMNFMVGGAMGV